MDFGVLGPLAVTGPRGGIDVVGGKERLLLAHLVSAAGRMVTVDELGDSLWGPRLPRAPAKALQTYVLRLRNALEPDRRGTPTVVVTEASGYRLAVLDQQVDALRFTRLAVAGRNALDEGRPIEAAETLREALGLWRGPAYAGFEETPFGRSEGQRLAELRTNATEDRWAAEVDAGCSAVAIPELERFLADHPWRERAWAFLSLALYRAGRQGEALGALDRARERLAEDLGVDPGPELRALRARMLAQDSELMRPPTRPTAEPGPVVPAVSLEQARAETVSLVREEAGAVATSADTLRGDRAELAGGLLALQRGAEAGSLPPDVCPWRGLASYDVEDSPWFAGRERLVAELLSRLAADRLVAVVGASGSGKSSLVRAGLLGALARGALPGSSRWTTISMRPGAAPMRALAAEALGAARATTSLGDLLLQLAREGPEDDADHRTVLVVDQLEEVWTECSDEHERESFLDALAAAANETDARVVLVVRGDYFSHLAEHQELAALVRDATVLVGSPTRAEVRRMVEVPARAADVELDPGLGETIADDAGSEPGLLPLLSSSLMLLWERREGRRLTYRDYVTIGGLAGAVAHVAERAYEGLVERDRTVARVVLLRLAGRPGPGDVVRRRVTLAEIDGLPGDARRVVASLAGARLLTLSDDAVEVAHESLFREWPRLAAWLAEDESARAVQHRLAVAADQWDGQGRDPGLLWRGAGLEAALDVAVTHADETTAVEREFLAASEAVLEADRREAEERARQGERKNRALRALLTVATVLLVLSVVAVALAVASRRDTADALARQAAAASAAEARRLAAASLSEDGLDLALLQAVEAVRTEPGPQTHGALLTLLARAPELVRLHRGETPYLAAAAGPDGRLVAAAEYDPRVLGVDARSGDRVWTSTVPDGGHVLSLDGGPRGFLLHSWTDAGATAVHVLDADSGAVLDTLDRGDLAELVGPAGDPTPAGAVWDARGRMVVLTPSHLLLLSPDQEPRRVVELRNTPNPGALRAWPDGRVSFEAPVDSGSGWVVDPARPGRPARSLDFRVDSVSPDGDLVLTADRSRADLVRLRLRDSRTFRPVGEAMTVSSFDGGVDWSADGQSFAVGAGEVIQLRGRDGRLLRELAGAHSGAVMAPVLAGAGGRALWAAGRDGLLSGWDLSGRRGLLRDTVLERGPHNGRADDAGRLAGGTLFSFTEPNRPVLLDARTGRTSPLPVPPDCSCQADSVTVTPDGTLAVGAMTVLGEAGLDPGAGRVLVWSTRDRRLLHSVALPWHPIAAAVLPDGGRALVNGGGGLAVVELRTGEVVAGPTDLPDHLAYDRARSVAVREDGDLAAVLRRDEVLLVEASTGELLSRSPLDSASTTARGGTAVGWAGDHVVVGGLDGRLSFLDGDSLEPVAPAREASAGFVVDVLAVGDLLATLGSDGEARLWDVRTWQPVGLPLTEEHYWGFLSAVPGELVVWLEGPEGGPGRLRRLALSPAAWVRRACAVTSRQLTRDEWAVIHPGRAWRETCSTAHR